MDLDPGGVTRRDNERDAIGSDEIDERRERVSGRVVSPGSAERITRPRQCR